MKTKTYRAYNLFYALQFSLGFFFISLVLGDFYSFIKSLFFVDIDSARAFAQAVGKIDWLRLSWLSLFIGISNTVIIRYYTRRKEIKANPAKTVEPESKLIAATLRNYKTSILTWWQETGQCQWRRWGIWVLIALCVFFFLFGSDFVEGMQNARENFAKGYEKGYKRGGGTSEHAAPPDIGFWFPLIIGIPVFVFFVIFFGKIAGRIHYFLIYKPILRSYKTANVVLYFVMSLLIYNTFLADVIFQKIVEVEGDNVKDMLAFGIWTFSLMFSIIYDYKKNEDTKKALEKERNEAQIQALKAQINPHFLFNTLNNLYGTALVEESPKTAGGIQQLAQIMRHAVESSQHERIEIEKEISFLHDYIELQQIRLPKRDNIRIDTRITWDEEPAEITPLILMTFVENAFKYGINPTQECFVEMNLTIEKKHLTFVCRNSIVARTQLESGTGMGVENTLKRLNLLYPDRHTISINHTEAIYEMFLTLQLT